MACSGRVLGNDEWQAGGREEGGMDGLSQRQRGENGIMERGRRRAANAPALG